MKVWFIADLHFGHKLMIQNNQRPFKTITEHDDVLIFNWNNVVSENDIVFMLGDIFFCNKERSLEIMSLLKGRKFLCIGNHDTRKIQYYYYLGFEQVQTLGLYNGFHLSHKPLKPNEINGFSFEDSFNICGHIHQPLTGQEEMEAYHGHPERYLSVAVEQTGYRPLTYQEVVERFAKRLCR